MQGRHVTGVAAGGRGNDGGHTAIDVRGEVGDELWMCGHGRWGRLGDVKRAVLARAVLARGRAAAHLRLEVPSRLGTARWRPSGLRGSAMVAWAL